MIKLIFLAILIFNINNIILAAENRIIFKINNKSFTTLDIDNRKKYLEFIGDNEEVDYELLLNDFISANIFNEYNLNLKNGFNDNKKIDEIYDNIITQIRTEINIDENIIKYHLKLDYIRKLVIENFLNERRSEITSIQEDENLLYKFIIEYVNINKNDYKKLYNNIEDINFNNFNELLEFLKSNKIPFFKTKKEIENINNLDKKIKNNLMLDNNFFLINNSNYLSFINITKKFVTYDGLSAVIYRFESETKMTIDEIQCKNVTQLEPEKYNLELKQYKYNKLNKQIRENLISLNDYILFSDNSIYTYVVLCDLVFDKNILNNFNLNKKISYTVEDIEKEFIQKYSKIYNLKLFE